MKIIKRLVIVAVVFVLLIAVGLVVAVMSINSIAKAGIEKGGTYALGVPTKLDSISISLLGGSVTLDGLNVANPSGFTSPTFMGLGHGYVSASLGTLNKDIVELPELTLENSTLNLEKNDKGANYRVIMDNLAKLQGTSAPAPKPDAEGSGKKFVIKQLRIKNVKVSAQLIGAPGAVGNVLNKATAVNVTIDEIKLENVGKTGQGVAGSGVTMGQLSGIVMQAILAAAADKAGGLIPGDILGDLKGGLGNLKPLTDLGVGAVTNVAEKVGEIGKQAADKVGEGLKGVGDKLGEGLKDIIPGGKK